MRQHKEEQERLHARLAALEAEFVVCRRQPFKSISALPRTSDYKSWQGQKGLGEKHGHGKTVNGKGGKWSRWKYMEEKENKRLELSGKQENHKGVDMVAGVYRNFSDSGIYGYLMSDIMN